MSSARSRTCVMQESRGSRRHSTTSFGEIEIVVEADTSYQMFVILSFWDGDKALLQSIKITVLTFLVKKKSYMNLLRVRVCIMTVLEKPLSQISSSTSSNQKISNIKQSFIGQ